MWQEPQMTPLKDSGLKLSSRQDSQATRPRGQDTYFAAQSAFPGPAAWASPGSLLEMIESQAPLSTC